GAARLNDDAVGRDVQADVVVLAERSGVGEGRIDRADPEPVLQVWPHGFGEEVGRLARRDERQLSHVHGHSALLRRSPMNASSRGSSEVNRSTSSPTWSGREKPACLRKDITLDQSRYL